VRLLVALLFSFALVACGGPATETAQVSPTPPPNASVDLIVPNLPSPPVDPTTVCGLYKALTQSAVDMRAFAQAILDGADHESVARAADAYADATADWDALALEIVSRGDYGQVIGYSASDLVDGFKVANDIPRTARYFARSIRGQETEYPLVTVAEGLATEDAYGALIFVDLALTDLCSVK